MNDNELVGALTQDFIDQLDVQLEAGEETILFEIEQLFLRRILKDYLVRIGVL